MIWFRRNSPYTLILEARSSQLTDQWLIKCERSNLSQFYNFFSFTIPLNESIGCRAGHFLLCLEPRFVCSTIIADWPSCLKEFPYKFLCDNKGSPR